MSYLSVTRTTFYYLFYPIATILSWLLVAVSPILHLLQYLLHALALPLRILARFEVGFHRCNILKLNVSQTLYIYLGVATVVGVVTGSILHFSSNIIISALDLRSKLEEKAPKVGGSLHASRTTPASSLDAWSPAVSRSKAASSSRASIDPSMKREYADWLDRDRARKREGLMAQTILEEDDDSEYDF